MVNAIRQVTVVVRLQNLVVPQAAVVALAVLLGTTKMGSVIQTVQLQTEIHVVQIRIVVVILVAQTLVQAILITINAMLIVQQQRVELVMEVTATATQA